MIGTVKWFNNAKGYGFVRPINDEGEDIFVHFSTILMDGYKTLKAGQLVEFEISTGPKGLHAINIRSNISETALIDNASSLSERSIMTQIISTSDAGA
jgi:CspA family cold shock protein